MKLKTNKIVFLKIALQWNAENINAYDYYETFTNESNYGINELVDMPLNKSNTYIYIHTRIYMNMCVFVCTCRYVFVRVYTLVVEYFCCICLMINITKKIYPSFSCLSLWSAYLSLLVFLSIFV